MTNFEKGNEEQLAGILGTLASLKQEPLCTVDDVVYWFRMNINNLCACVCGTHEVMIGETIGYDIKLESKSDNHLYLVVCIEWLRSSSKDIEERINALRGVPMDAALTIQSLETTTLEAQVTLNLDNWKNLVPSIISGYLYSDIIDTKKPVRVNHMNKVNVALLLERYFPEITPDLAQTAADLGFVTWDETVFVQWLNDHLANKVNTNVSMPGDFDLN